MGKPVEKQNHSLAFFVLAMLIAGATVWAFWDELRGSRPWKGYQEQAFALERQKAALDLRSIERRVESGAVKVPVGPDAGIPVAEARARLEELRQAQGAQSEEIRRLKSELKAAERAEAWAEEALRALKSGDDALFYRAQKAQREQALAFEEAKRSALGGDPGGAAGHRRRAEEAAAQLAELESERGRQAGKIGAGAAELAKAKEAVAAARAGYQAKAGEAERLEAALDTALDPLLTARATLESVRRKDSQLAQYWLTGLGGAVDRCQSCHVTIDRCGFSRPHEVLAALASPDAVPEEVAGAFCVNPETLANYQVTAEAVCGLDWVKELAADGAGECLVVMDDRRRVASFLRTYCGPVLPALSFLEDAREQAACLTPSEWAAIAPFVEDPTHKRGANAHIWSACELPLSAEGESCVEGARHDGLELWLAGHCAPGAPVLEGLRRHPKACASGDDGRRLAALRPVLFEAPAFAQTHPRRRELLGTSHPPDRFGCTVCHEGQGAQTKGVGGAPFRHGWDDASWERPLLDLVSRKKFRPAGFGPPEPEVGVPGEWVEKQGHFVQSACAKCHTDEIAIPFADTYGRGRRLVTELGCSACHPVDGLEGFPRIGPSLAALKQKTTPDFLARWVAFPRGVRPRTKMPNFWPEALDVRHGLREGSPQATRRADEVRDIVSFLWKRSAQAQLPEPPKGDAERGRVLSNAAGCRACHSFSPVEKLCTPEQVKAGKSRGTAAAPGECEVARSLSGSSARDLAPNLSAEGFAANPRWLFAYLKNPQALWKEARMPSFRLSDQEAADLTAYLTTLKDGEAPAAQPFFADEAAPEFSQAAERGGKLITRYGCAGCHQLPGHEADAKVGTDFNGYGRKPSDLFDFGTTMPNPRERNWYSFVDLKLRAPHAFRYERVDTRMPQYDLDDGEVDALMNYLKSRTGDRVPPSYGLARNERITSQAKGEQVIDQYACRNCHLIGGTGGALRDSFRVEDLAKLAPPTLQSQGWRTQPDWLFEFLKDPSLSMRPWLTVRMPTFPLSDAQDTALVRGFAAADDVPYPYVTAEVKPLKGEQLVEASALFQKLKCMTCHPVGKPAPEADRAALAPNFLLAPKRLRPDWVVAFIKTPQSLQEGTRMPAFFNTDDFEAVMYPQYFGGSQQKQIEVLADYLMTLNEKEAAKLEAAAIKAAREAAAQPPQP
ncbi:MAG: c-type cytochrome [Myxococcaceae bacterium]